MFKWSPSNEELFYRNLIQVGALSNSPYILPIESKYPGITFKLPTERIFARIISTTTLSIFVIVIAFSKLPFWYFIILGLPLYYLIDILIFQHLFFRKNYSQNFEYILNKKELSLKAYKQEREVNIKLQNIVKIQQLSDFKSDKLFKLIPIYKKYYKKIQHKVLKIYYKKPEKEGTYSLLLVGIPKDSKSKINKFLITNTTINSIE